MGRRGLDVTQDERWVFNRLADAYAHRPAYPDALVDRLAGLAAEGPVAELGAGLGHLAIPLAARGLRVFAVEPARRMLEALRARSLAGVEAVHGSAEESTLSESAFGLVVLADALQWVDPERAGHEVARLLRRGGACAVVEARLGGSAFTDALVERVAALNPKARPAKSGALEQLLSLSVGRKPAWTERFSHEVTLEPGALEGVIRSLSWVGPALAPGAVDGLVEEARALAQAHGALWRRELVLTWARTSA